MRIWKLVGTTWKHYWRVVSLRRDSRGDCKQVCIGLVCTPDGLPLNYEVFAGNRTDVTTVEEIVAKMEGRFGKAERIWVMDRGMVCESNIAFLREHKARYIVGTPKTQLRAFETQLAEKKNWTDVQNGVEAKLVEAIGAVRSMDVVVPVKRGKRIINLRLRTVAKPDKDVTLLLAHLGLHLPKGSKLLQSVVEKKC